MNQAQPDPDWDDNIVSQASKVYAGVVIAKTEHLY